MDKLYILPFDHRNFFVKFFGFETPLTDVQREKIVEAKQIIYRGLLSAIDQGIRREDTALLVDEEFGGDILKAALSAHIRRILTVEKSGQEEFQFEYGDDFASHIEAVNPDFVKVLVRYNPEGDKAGNMRQRERLKVLSEFCAENGYLFLFELLVPPLEKGDPTFDGEPRAALTGVSIRELARDGILPDVWKLEGFDTSEQLARVMENVKEETPDASVVILGRGEDAQKVEQWLTVGAAFPQVTGFAVGRTVFAEPLLAWHGGSVSDKQASQQIAEKFTHFISVFESGR